MIKKTRYEAAAAAASNGGGAAAAAAANNNLPPSQQQQQQKPPFASLPSATLAALNAVAAQVDKVPDVNDAANRVKAAPTPLMTVPTAPPTQLQQPPPAVATGPAAESAAAAAAATPLTPDQIKAMMENAKKMIAAKKAAAGAAAIPAAAAAASPTVTPAAPGVATVRPAFPPPRPMFPTEEPDLPIPGGRSKVVNAEEQDKLKRAAQLQAQIKAKLQSMTMVPDLMSVENKAKEAAAEATKLAAEKKPQAPKLIIDAQGRTLDAEGNEITIAPRVPELKANLRAVQREAMKSGIASVIPGVAGSSTGVVLHPGGVVMKVEPPENKYLDYRIEQKAAGRSKRGFKFHDAGKFQQMASRLRTKAQLEKLQNQVSERGFWDANEIDTSSVYSSHTVHSFARIPLTRSLA